MATLAVSVVLARAISLLKGAACSRPAAASSKGLPTSVTDWSQVEWMLRPDKSDLRSGPCLSKFELELKLQSTLYSAPTLGPC